MIDSVATVKGKYKEIMDVPTGLQQGVTQLENSRQAGKVNFLGYSSPSILNSKYYPFVNWHEPKNFSV